LVATNDVKKKIIDGLGLEDIEVDEIEDDMALFGDDGLGLDSVDAIELTLILEKEFGVKIVKMDEAQNIFETATTLTNYINEQKQA
jgi:acyl carrier protein